MVESSFRILAAYRTPSAILFQRTTDIRHFTRSYPTCLEVAAALGSSFARENIADSQKVDLLKTIDSYKTHFSKGQSLYLLYLDSLQALVDKPEHDAPDFMKNEAWQRKSCNTVLAGWAQLRHTWALQAKQSEEFLGMAGTPAGFVEPEPEFFSRMAFLAGCTRELFKRAGGFEPDYPRLVLFIERLKDSVKGMKNFKQYKERLSDLFKGSMRLGGDMEVRVADELFNQAGTRSSGLEISMASIEGFEEEEFNALSKLCDTVLADIKAGRLDKHPNPDYS